MTQKEATTSFRVLHQTPQKQQSSWSPDRHLQIINNFARYMLYLQVLLNKVFGKHLRVQQRLQPKDVGELFLEEMRCVRREVERGKVHPLTKIMQVSHVAPSFVNLPFQGCSSRKRATYKGVDTVPQLPLLEGWSEQEDEASGDRK